MQAPTWYLGRHHVQHYGLNTQQQRLAVSCELGTPTLLAMNPAPELPGTSAMYGPRPSDAAPSVCVGRADMKLTHHLHAPSTVTSAAADQPVANSAGQQASAAQLAVSSTKFPMLSGKQASTIPPDVHSTLALATAGTSQCSLVSATEQPTLLTALRTGPVMLLIRQRLSKASTLALFRTCKAARDTLLRQSHSIGLEGHLLQKQSHEHLLNAVQLASKHSNSICLVLNKPDDPEYKPEYEPKPSPEKESAWPGLCIPQLVREQGHLSERTHKLLQEGHRMGVFTGLTKLVLTGMYLDAPLPSVLGRMCPNLTTLSLRSSVVHFQSADIDNFTPAFPKLQKLQLHDVGWCGPISKWQQQLQQVAQLHALTSLSLTTSRWEEALEDGCMFFKTNYGQLYGTMAQAAVTAAASQLTHLALCWNAEEYTIDTSKAWAMVVTSSTSHLCAVQRLALDMIAWDEELLVLLSLPCLTHLSVHSVHPSHSYAGHHCRWQVLEVSDLCVENLAWLPLHANLRIKATGWQGTDISWHFNRWIPAAATVEEAQANIASSGWLGWRYDAEVSLWTGRDEESLMLQALPLLTGASLFMDGWRLSSTGMSVLGKFAAKQKSGFRLDLQSHCTWAVADMLTLVSCMPAGSHLTVCDISEETFIKLCCVANGRSTVHAMLAEQPKIGFCRRMKVALASCGQHTAWVSASSRVQCWHPEMFRWEWVVHWR